MDKDLAPEIIEADSILVEVVDKETGIKVRRELPVRYTETANGVVLAGEGLDGSQQAIAFLSDSALARMSDLFGKGPDAPRCGNHDHEAEG